MNETHELFVESVWRIGLVFALMNISVFAVAASDVNYAEFTMTQQAVFGFGFVLMMCAVFVKAFIAGYRWSTA